MTADAFYLVSTPLQFLVASSIALRQRDTGRHHLLYIDQAPVAAHPYLDCEARWQQSPFASRHLFFGRERRVLAKLQLRRSNFKRIAALVKEIQPARIYVGNDRRIEFQYAMHVAQQFKPVTGIYMDEGTFTYVGRGDSRSFGDAVVDNVLKKIVYGAWWRNPPTVGASSWISEAYVAFPELVHPLLQQKKLHRLGSDYFATDAFRALAAHIVEHFRVDAARLAALSLLLTLPHESVMARVPGYADRIRQLVRDLAARGRQIGVKYHPRNSQPDALELGGIDGVSLIPDGAAFESFLPLLQQCTVVGDMSSTLPTTRWLRPGLTVIAIENPGSAFFAQFNTLFAALSIPVRTPAAAVQELLHE